MNVFAARAAKKTEEIRLLIIPGVLKNTGRARGRTGIAASFALTRDAARVTPHNSAVQIPRKCSAPHISGPIRQPAYGHQSREIKLPSRRARYCSPRVTTFFPRTSRSGRATL